jgi:uncharacterized BrkB/YihY/UPF0761 family membrane protein
MKKRFYIITFIFLPICFFIGVIISTKIAVVLDYHVDDMGMLVVALGLVPVYFLGVLTAYRELKKKSKQCE